MVGVALLVSYGGANLQVTSQYGLFSLLGRVTAIIGVILYAISFVLSTRWRSTERLFGGLNRTYIAHHQIAGLAFIFVLLHPLMLAARYIFVDNSAAISQLLPVLRPYDFAVNAGIFGLWLMIALLIFTYYIKLPYHIWIWTHRVLGLTLLMVAVHVFLTSSDVSRDMALRIYILAWIAIGLWAFTYRVLFHKFLVRRRKMKVIDIERTASGIFDITLETTDGKPFNLEAGQFVFIKFSQPGFPREEHPFSIAGKPAPHKIELGVKSLGDFTDRMDELQPGAEALVEGSFGTFNYRRAKNKKQLWIGGGIGVTPFLSMAQDLARRPKYDVAMIYSTAKRQDLFKVELLSSLQRQSNFNLHEYVNEENGGNFLDVDFIKHSAPDLNEREVFICGPPAMMRSLRAQLRGAGIKNKNIHTEEFSLQ